MIYTLTLNPALDYICDVEDFRLGAINRSRREVLRPGGKGINVSQVLNILGNESIAFCFTAGESGRLLEQLLKQSALPHRCIELASGSSRLNVKIRSQEETALNASGPLIGEKDLQTLMKAMQGILPGDLLILSGSLPASSEKDIYARIIRSLRKKQEHIQIALDSSGAAFEAGLAAGLDLVKPNREEAEFFCRRKIRNKKEAAEAASEIQKAGARNVLLSLGGDGALFYAEDGRCLYGKAPEGRAVNTVGAGDALLAGFVHAYASGKSAAECLALGLAAGSASAFTEGLPEKECIFELAKACELKEF